MSPEFSNSLIFDRNLLLQRRAKTVNSLAKADFLIKRSFDDIQERLSEIGREFPLILNLGSRIGSQELSNRLNTIQVTEADFSPTLLEKSSHLVKIVIDEEHISFASNQFDLIISVLNLHKVNDLPGCLTKLKDALKPNGVLIASMFGGMNLPQLREMLVKTELELLGGISPRMMPSVEIKQLGGLLQRVGFISPIIDRDIVEVHYPHPLALLHDLQNMGETNIMINRKKTYLGKEFWLRLAQNYINEYSINDSEVIAHFEILTMTGLKVQ